MNNENLPLGIRNNNPGNIKYAATSRWQGLSAMPQNRGFCVFDQACYGIRAMAVTLITYQDKRVAADGSAIDTITEVVERWAPRVPEGTENPHQAQYIHFVLKRSGLIKGQHIDLHEFGTMQKIITAMIEFENGVQPYSDAQITKGIVMAGVQSPAPQLSKSRTMKGAQLAGGATVLGMAAQSVESFTPAFPLIQNVITYAPWIVGVAALGGLAWIIYARWSDSRRGLR